MKRYYTDRSRSLDALRCRRLRWHGHECDTGGEVRGLELERKPLPLVVGSAVHAGLAHLLKHGRLVEGALQQPATLEDAAVAAALVEFEHEAGRDAQGLELDDTEQAAQAKQVTTLGKQLVDSALAWDMPTDTPEMQALQADVASGGKRFDEWLWKEQQALVEGMVRAYARRRLRPLLEQFEVLEVEREGRWKLSEWQHGWVAVDCICGWHGTFDENHRYPRNCPNDTTQDGSHYVRASKDACELWFLSRPDALLLDRESRELYLLSYKTAATWDIRKAKDASVDMQGLTEGLEVEARLAEWWQLVYDGLEASKQRDVGITEEMFRFLASCTAPPRIHAIRYEYLLKQSRYVDKELSERVGFEARSQRSPLIRGYLNKGMTAADAQWSVSYDHLKIDGQPTNLYYKNWKNTAVWEHMPVREWIDRLDDTRQVELPGGGVAWESAAQAAGLLKEHPLDAQFVEPIVIYRSVDDLYDLVEQLEAQEVAVAQDADRVRAATDVGERRHLLNVHFPMNRQQCAYPTTCRMWKLCHGSEEQRTRPLENGYRTRRPNHPEQAGEPDGSARVV